MKAFLQRGFSAVELAIVLFVLAAVVTAGYLAYNRIQYSSKSPTAAEQQDQAVTPAAPSINDAGDLDAAIKALDQTDIDASAVDSSELDSEVSAF